MALFTLEALVLRGSVLRDVVALDLRLGTSGDAGTQAAAAPVIPVRHPWPNPNAEFGQPKRLPDRVVDVVGIIGAGRSRRVTGVPCPTSPARTAGAALARG